MHTMHAQHLFTPTLLQDKVVIVTGGAAGIGRAIVNACAQHGALVVFADMNQEKGVALSHELTDSNKQHCFIQGDLTDETVCKKVVDTALKHFGHIDVLINNAGFNDSIGLKATPTAFKTSVEKNLMHYFMMLHYALEPLKKSKGTVINIASKVALTGQGNTSGYAAAKGAILGLTREWAVELAHYGMRVNAVIPAEVYTEAYKAWINTYANPEQTLHDIMQKIPLDQRMTSMEEIANTVLFLASPLAAHTTGQFLSVDGGYVHLDRAFTILNKKEA